jgi:ubiquinone/menaquinone biosynthesis C-methylase UbiE
VFACACPRPENKEREKNMTTAKAYKGMAMEGPIAAWYAKITLKDLKRHKLMAVQMVKRIPAGGRVLEIAPGPGYFCIELAKLGNYQITGLDISKSFVEIAQKNAAEAGIKAEFRQGDAANMPFGGESFDFLFCQAAFKNFSQPVKAIAEMYRVLRPGGVGAIADLRRDASQADIEQEIKGMGLGPVNEMMVRWTFRQMLLKSAYSIDEMRSMVAPTSFGKCRIDTNGIGFTVWLEK